MLEIEFRLIFLTGRRGSTTTRIQNEFENCTLTSFTARFLKLDKMELLSVTNKKTQLHKSPSDLSIACTQEHNQKRAVSSDICVFASSAASKCFMQINKTDLVEVWRIKPSADGNRKLHSK